MPGFGLYDLEATVPTVALRALAKTTTSRTYLPAKHEESGMMPGHG
jgi:hypothetical protein